MSSGNRLESKDAAATSHEEDDDDDERVGLEAALQPHKHILIPRNGFQLQRDVVAS